MKLWKGLIKPLPGYYLDGKVYKRRPMIRDPADYNFVAGHTLSRSENMPPESNAKRMAGLIKTWKVLSLKSQGYRIPTVKVRRKISKNALEAHRRSRQQKVIKNAREIQQMALDNSGAAIGTVLEVMHDKRARGSERLTAAEMVLNRAAGRPTQTNINANVDANAPTQEATGKELDQRIAETLERIDRVTGRAPKKVARKKRPINIRVDDRNTGGSTVH